MQCPASSIPSATWRNNRSGARIAVFRSRRRWAGRCRWRWAANGKPTTSPKLPGLPPVRVVAEYRDALNEIPYVIAAGQRLGDWLADFLAMLGLRAELRGFEDGRTDLTLTDSVPRGQPFEMPVVTPTGTDPPGSDSSDSILISNHTALPGAPLRGALLDDPTKGSARSLLKYGAVGNGIDRRRT